MSEKTHFLTFTVAGSGREFERHPYGYAPTYPNPGGESTAELQLSCPPNPNPTLCAGETGLASRSFARATTVSPGPGRYNIRSSTDCRTALIAISSRDWGELSRHSVPSWEQFPGPKVQL